MQSAQILQYASCMLYLYDKHAEVMIQCCFLKVLLPHTGHSYQMHVIALLLIMPSITHFPPLEMSLWSQDEIAFNIGINDFHNSTKGRL